MMKPQKLTYRLPLSHVQIVGPLSRTFEIMVVIIYDQELVAQGVVIIFALSAYMTQGWIGTTVQMVVVCFAVKGVIVNYVLTVSQANPAWMKVSLPVMDV